jgi:hypothetical protein
MRGSEAIRDIFSFSRGLSSVTRGLFELVGLSGLLRRGVGGTYIGAVFEQHKAFEPINELPLVVDKLGPRLEGKDVQDIDDLVKYARREIEALPPAMRTKVIGAVQPPLHYDRAALQGVREDLQALEDEGRKVETERLESRLRNSMLYLAAYELLLVALAIAFFVTDPFPPDQPFAPLVALVLFLAFGVIGFLIMPLRGRMTESQYTSRMLRLQARYIETLTKAADRQVSYGMNLRRDAILPLTRLIDAQTTIQREQLSRLQTAQQEMVQIEADLTALGKRSLFGIRG